MSHKKYVNNYDTQLKWKKTVVNKFLHFYKVKKVLINISPYFIHVSLTKLIMEYVNTISMKQSILYITVR